MKSQKRKRIIIACGVLLVLLLAYSFAKPHLNRLFDNRERAVMYRHNLIINEKIQTIARQSGAYPSSDKVKSIIENSGLISPHTKKPYNFIGAVEDVDNVEDSQIAYGLGEYKGDSKDTTQAYVCIGVSLPRTHEGGASCDTLRLNSETDALIKYGLSCETNWLGFSTGCDETILQSFQKQ